ncbi:sorbosone dehydrogenase family protein [Flagellimonas sp. DF-77]|uniref:PQQ-dependent sugar dehydrogenase n=1 Tax=Flagellimonas algarum TaxID=3230298 RepID=UPI003394C4E8
MEISRTKVYAYALGMMILLAGACKQKAEDESQVASVPEAQPTLPLERLNLPEGFTIELYAEGIDGARSMAMGDEGTLFVGTRNEKTVYAIQDQDGDFKADKVMVLDSTLEVPNGIAFRDGDLYVAEVGRLLRYDEIESHLEDFEVIPEIVYDDYPTEFHHGWKYIAFGPDDKLYVPVGAPCNICDSTVADQRYATITRMDPDGNNREIYAHGVRNTVGFTWHPETKEMWFTDNGRDMMGDDVPPCELNRISRAGQHFGYPYCHGGTVADPEFNDRDCDEFTAPVQAMGAHVAPLAVKFYRGDMFPESYRNYAFVAEHGSWNRSKKVGYRIALVELDGNESVGYTTFIDGWLDDESQDQFGRPVDILFLEDGSMLISDDYGDAIYRVHYTDPS